jgi:hypothetical protein
MLELAASPGLVNQLGARGRALAETLTWERAAEQTEHHLEQTIQEAKGD